MLVSESPQSYAPPQPFNWKNLVVAKAFHRCQACAWPIYPGERYYCDQTGKEFVIKTQSWRDLDRPIKRCQFCQEHICKYGGYTNNISWQSLVGGMVRHFVCDQMGWNPFFIDSYSFAIHAPERERVWREVERSPAWIKMRRRRLGL